MLARFALAACAFGSFLAAGCGPGKLDQTRTVTLDTETGAQVIFLGAQPKPQTITVDFSSSDKEVRVLVFKRQDAKTPEEGFEADPKLALASKQAQADTFSVEVPADTALAVVIRGAQAPKTSVTVKLTNAK